MSRVRVRMYRQGLGDCFLLTFWTNGSPAHILIDCGVLKGTPEPKVKMRMVAESIRDTTGGHVDLLVSTHEHWDHLSGFLQARDVFEELSFGAVWLAWTEDPGDELANELRVHRKQARRALAAAKHQLTGLRGAAARSMFDRLDALLGFHGDVALDGSATTANALEWVKARGVPKFLRPGEQRDAAGVRVYVLGPPHDRKQIKRSDPSKAHPEVYELGADAGAALGFLDAAARPENGGSARQPFDAWYRIGDDEASSDEFFARRYLARRETWRRIDRDWLGAAGRLALALDSDTNNTSLVLAFELGDGGPVLLFPGDAQVGTWVSWQTVEWATTGGAKPETNDLLARTVLYKVGHHGSHNATLREVGLELMTSPELVAMIPVNRQTAKKMDWNMPFPPLFKRLEEKTRGRVLDAELGVAGTKPDGMPEAEWQRFCDRTVVADGWVDYTLEW